MQNDYYAISDLDGYATQMRKAAGEFISQDNTDNLEDYISIGQIINLVNDHCLGYDNENRPILDEETNEFLFESTVDWIHNVGLAKLASQGLVECAWDDKTNEMVFWSPSSQLTLKDKDTKNEPKRKRKNRKPKG